MSKIKPLSTHQGNKEMLEAECPEIYAANQISGQWTLAICGYLVQGRLRFSELKKYMPTISERMLALELRKMEERRLVIRIVHAEVPARVEYELTESGLELIPIIRQLEQWGVRHRERINS